jgi:DNA-binding Xre family transcriptional regulator
MLPYMETNHGKLMQRAVRKQIRIEIALRNLKPADVARSAGMYTSTLSRYLNDSQDKPLPFEVLDAIAVALDMLPEQIIANARGLLDDLRKEDEE